MAPRAAKSPAPDDTHHFSRPPIAVYSHVWQGHWRVAISAVKVILLKLKWAIGTPDADDAIGVIRVQSHVGLIYILYRKPTYCRIDILYRRPMSIETFSRAFPFWLKSDGVPA